MSYGSKQVNVGALLNPTEGVSRSLSDLSAMYGRQADKENSHSIGQWHGGQRQKETHVGKDHAEATTDMHLKAFGTQNLEATVKRHHQEQ